MTTFDSVVADARVHLPGAEVVEGWLAVRDGLVASIGTGAAPAARDLYDAGGRDVIPGVIDIHTHFRDPGDTHKEDFSTGTLAAIFGGVTTVIDMPNTGHQVVTPDDFRDKRDHLAGRAWADYGLHACLMDSASYVRELRELGVAGLKWMMGYRFWKEFECQPSNNAELRATLIEAAANDVLVGIHAESLPWLEQLREWLRAEGREDLRAHGESRPPFVEAIALAEAAILAAEFGFRLHVHHTTAEMPLKTAIALRDALGIRLTVETCPSYLYLTHDDVEAQGVDIQVNPPMRSQVDREAMWEGIGSREIHCVASDHAPTVPEDKQDRNPLDALPGVVGVETMLPLMLDSVAEGRLSLPRMIELLCFNPARLVRLGHRKGAVVPGYDADLVVVDLEGTVELRSENLHSKQKFTPYHGRVCKGSIEGVFVRGRPVVLERRLVSDRSVGEHVPSDYSGVSRATVSVGMAA